MSTMPWNGPMRLELASGAVLLIERPEQLTAIPPETTFEPVAMDKPSHVDGYTQPAKDSEGRVVYREIAPQKAALAILATMGEELKAAAEALFTAARVIKESGHSPLKASQVHQAATRASQAHLEIVGQGQ